MSRLLPIRSALANPAGPSSSSTPCRFFAAGSCREGRRCKFSHASAAPPQPTATKWRSGPAKSPELKVACHFFQEGRCREGADCRFLHTGEVVEPPKVLQSDNWARELSGAFVQFEDGARVSKVSLRSDFSAVQLTIQPATTEVLWVAQFLRSLRFTIPEESIRVLDNEDGKSKVEIRVEDPSFAAKVCRKLQVREDLGVKTPLVTGIPIPVRMPRASNSFRLDRRKVHVSWDAAMRRVSVPYNVEDTAKRAYQSLRDSNFALHEQPITVVGSAPSKHGDWNWVKLDVSPEATRQDVFNSIPPELRPRKTEHVRMGDVTYEEDPKAAMAMVLSSLQIYGTLETYEFTTREGSAQVRLKALFLDEADAQKAAKELHDSTPDFHKDGKLTVEVVSSAKWKVSERIFNVVFAEVGSARKDFKSQGLRFTSYPPAVGLVQLKLEGEDRQLVKQAKDTLNRILNFEIATRDGKELWYPLFGTNGDALQEIRDLETRLNIFVKRDIRKSHLRLYGSPGKRQEATAILADIIRELSEATQYIVLGDKQAEWLRQGGLAAVSRVAGKGNVFLDVHSTPKQLFVNSSKQDYRTVQAMVNACKRDTGRNWRGTRAARNNDDDCAICLTPADDLVRTACSHTYCRDCFENMCSHSAGTGLVRCEGEGGQCKITLGMAELQGHLSPSSFEEMLEASFTYYVRHSRKFKYCPTPDCLQIYRDASGETTPSYIFNCTKCLRASCTGCQELPHEGRTCAEQKDHLTGGYEALKQAMEQYTIKRCPKCKTLMNKESGCNHIQCLGCRAHICWECLDFFDTSGECYEHMRANGHS